MATMDDSGKLINHSSSKQDIFVDANENVNPISNTRKTAIAHNKTSDRITKRRIKKAMYALFF
jgi:hypothetical protein